MSTTPPSAGTSPVSTSKMYSDDAAALDVESAGQVISLAGAWSYQPGPDLAALCTSDESPCPDRGSAAAANGPQSGRRHPLHRPHPYSEVRRSLTLPTARSASMREAGCGSRAKLDVATSMPPRTF